MQHATAQGLLTCDSYHRLVIAIIAWFAHGWAKARCIVLLILPPVAGLPDRFKYHMMARCDDSISRNTKRF